MKLFIVMTENIARNTVVHFHQSNKSSMVLVDVPNFGRVEIDLKEKLDHLHRKIICDVIISNFTPMYV